MSYGEDKDNSDIALTLRGLLFNVRKYTYIIKYAETDTNMLKQIKNLNFIFEDTRTHRGLSILVKVEQGSMNQKPDTSDSQLDILFSST